MIFKNNILYNEKFYNEDKKLKLIIILIIYKIYILTYNVKIYIYFF